MTIKEAIEEIGELDNTTNLIQKFVFSLLSKGRAVEAVFHFRKSQKAGTWMMTNEMLKKTRCKRVNKRNKEKYGNIRDYTKHKPELLKLQNHSCKMCKRKCGSINLEIDHIIAITENGTNEIDNLQLLCRPCHLKKDKHLMNLSLEEQIKL